MPDLDALLGTPLDSDELESVNCPEGTWKAELLAIKVSETKTDKNGDEYKFARFIARPKEAQGDVDPGEAAEYLEKEGEEAIISYSMFLRRKRDFRQFANILGALGLPVKGRTVEEVTDEFNGGVDCLIEIKHVERDGETYDQGTSIAAVGNAAGADEL